MIAERILDAFFPKPLPSWRGDALKKCLAEQNVDISGLLSEPHYVKRSTPIDELLPHMSEHKFSVAIVRDMQDRTVGVVSVEDILEELVGEIYDEEEAGEEE